MKIEPVSFSGRLAVQQRVLPAYRVPFFENLADACEGGLSVFAGLPRPDEQIAAADQLEKAQFFPARNRHYFSVNSPLYQCWQEGILAWLERWQPDALIVEANPRYFSTRRAVSWMHNYNRPVLGWGLGIPAGKGVWSGIRNRSRLNFLRLLDGVIAYSQRGAAQYRAFGFPEERVFVACNAAAPRPQKPAPSRSPEFGGKAVVIFVGRLQMRKRIDLLLQACAHLPEALQPRLWIIGDGPARPEFERLAARTYPAAEFLGALYGADLESRFIQADLFVLPGTGGLAVQQAMAFALPVIVAQGDGTQDDLVRPENGWVLPPDDWKALSAALQSALSDPERLRRMGAESYRIVSEEVNLEKMTAAFVHALNQITRSGKSGFDLPSLAAKV